MVNYHVSTNWKNTDSISYLESFGPTYMTEVIGGLKEGEGTDDIWVHVKSGSRSKKVLKEFIAFSRGPYEGVLYVTPHLKRVMPGYPKKLGEVLDSCNAFYQENLSENLSDGGRSAKEVVDSLIPSLSHTLRNSNNDLMWGVKDITVGKAFTWDYLDSTSYVKKLLDGSRSLIREMLWDTPMYGYLTISIRRAYRVLFEGETYGKEYAAAGEYPIYIPSAVWYDSVRIRGCDIPDRRRIPAMSVPLPPTLYKEGRWWSGGTCVADVLSRRWFDTFPSDITAHFMAVLLDTGSSGGWSNTYGYVERDLYEYVRQHGRLWLDIWEKSTGLIDKRTMMSASDCSGRDESYFSMENIRTLAEAKPNMISANHMTVLDHIMMFSSEPARFSAFVEMMEGAGPLAAVRSRFWERARQQFRKNASPPEYLRHIPIDVVMQRLPDGDYVTGDAVRKAFNKHKLEEIF